MPFTRSIQALATTFKAKGIFKALCDMAHGASCTTYYKVKTVTGTMHEPVCDMAQRAAVFQRKKKANVSAEKSHSRVQIALFGPAT